MVSKAFVFVENPSIAVVKEVVVAKLVFIPIILVSTVLILVNKESILVF